MTVLELGSVMDRTFPRRRHVPHWEYPGGTVCLTWRLDRDQPPLRPDERTIVLEVIRSGSPGWAHLIAAVVMDDHVHALVRPAQGVSGQHLATAWKRMTALRLSAECGRSTPVWQRSYFDRWMRTDQQTSSCRQYVLGNPGRRWPDIESYQWVLSD